VSRKMARRDVMVRVVRRERRPSGLGGVSESQWIEKTGEGKMERRTCGEVGG
jgi:hypothetical protein